MTRSPVIPLIQLSAESDQVQKPDIMIVANNTLRIPIGLVTTFIVLLVFAGWMIVSFRGFYVNERKLAGMHQSIRPGMSSDAAYRLLKDSGFRLKTGPRSITVAARTGLDIQIFNVQLDESRSTVLDVDQTDVDLTFSRLPF